MSYPHQIRSLIIEDNPRKRRDYEDIFKRLSSYDILSPEFATCFDDGELLLQGDGIFHLVIIDLGLPQHLRGQESAGVEPGIELVSLAANRDHCPIPIVLVISGRLALTKTGLSESLKRDFFDGWTVGKNVDDEQEQIVRAIELIRKYCGVGIHLRNSGATNCPALSPREEDLLRRSTLKKNCVGVDSEWWSYSAAVSVTAPKTAEPASGTKVFMGRLLLDSENRPSRPTFFKFEPRAFAENSHLAAERLAQQLGHVKVMDSTLCASRGLLVTQKVGGSDSSPLTLTHLIAGERPVGVFDDVASAIGAQVAALGNLTHDEWPTSRLFASWHDAEKLRLVWNRYGGDDAAAPLQTLAELLSIETLIPVQIQSSAHGDLHIGNVAVDEVGASFQAFIFDGATLKHDIAVRDLAMLEVSLLLHQPRTATEASLLTDCSNLYLTGPGIADVRIVEGAGLRAKNTLELIVALRKCALLRSEPEIYAAAVFDAAMTQLGGLFYQVSGNRISEPRDAVALAAAIANWLPMVGFTRQEAPR